MHRTLFAVLLLLVSGAHLVQARHKCPKVPNPPGIMGIVVSPLLIPSGSTMATARSSDTSGCDRGHASENFYKPQKERITLFLEDNLLQVQEESAQGQGQHLDALALLAGCSIELAEFGTIIQLNYHQVFASDIFEQDAELSTNKANQTTERFLSLMKNSPFLAYKCESDKET